MVFYSSSSRPNMSDISNGTDCPTDSSVDEFTKLSSELCREHVEAFKEINLFVYGSTEIV